MNIHIFFSCPDIPPPGATPEANESDSPGRGKAQRQRAKGIFTSALLVATHFAVSVMAVTEDLP
jgi:hypothetical protein